MFDAPGFAPRFEYSDSVRGADGGAGDVTLHQSDTGGLCLLSASMQSDGGHGRDTSLSDAVFAIKYTMITG